MKGLGIEYVLKYCNNFDPYKTSKLSGQSVSAFAYISTIIFNGIIQVINAFSKEQEKMKAQIQEKQKMFHKDPNESTYIPEYEDIKYKNISLSYENLQKGLLKQMKKYTIHEPTMFIIPNDYRITEDDLHYIEKYTIGIKRINSDV
jgi:asparagine N-glycosylation enzyme membrane subunit Stt3